MAKPRTPAKPGRPTAVTPSIAKRIIERLADGETLRAICKDAGMPDERSVRRRALSDKAFGEKYEAARAIGYSAWFDEMREIADDGTNDYVERVRADGTKDTVFDAEHVHRSRLRVDTLKWMLGKALPKLYGDKLQHTGDGGGAIGLETLIVQSYGSEGAK